MYIYIIHIFIYLYINTHVYGFYIQLYICKKKKRDRHLCMYLFFYTCVFYVCVCVYMYTYMLPYVYIYTLIHIGKGIYRLHDQYGGQTHRHPPGEGQLNLRNFVLPSILPGSFFRQTSSHRRMASRRISSISAVVWSPGTRKPYINCERSFSLPWMHAQKKRPIAARNDATAQIKNNRPMRFYLVSRSTEKVPKNTIWKLAAKIVTNPANGRPARYMEIKICIGEQIFLDSAH